jgi:hypothetical protein
MKQVKPFSLKSILLLLVLLQVNLSSYANDTLKSCNCAKDFNWVVETFSNNDAGFQTVIEKKTQKAFEDFTKDLQTKALQITSLTECRDIMSLWLQFFRDGHVNIQILKPCETLQNVSGDDKIRYIYKDAERINLSELELINQLKKKAKIDPIEGVWQMNGYKVGIIEDPVKYNTFIAFVIQADSIYLLPGQIKARFTKNTNSDHYTILLARRDHSVRLDKAEMVNQSKTIFTILNNGSCWKRIFPMAQFTKDEIAGYDFYNKREVQFKKLSDQTIYLRIPSFNASFKKAIDSVLLANDQVIRSTPNFIIDIRNGTGGSDLAYSNIMPYLYTQPIRKVGIQLYGTELNAQSRESTAEEYTKLGLTETATNLRKHAEQMRKHPNLFFNPNEYPVKTTVKDTVLPYPQKVAIICNYGNGSTDEQFLLDAKQSYKVKVFGRPTQGVLDISNMSFVTSSNGVFQLGYSMSKSYRLPYFGIDGVGIQPDYFIDTEVNVFNWVNHVQNILENQ